MPAQNNNKYPCFPPQSDSVNRLVKPAILAVFGDIALAIGPEFKKYLDVVLTTLAQASQARVDSVSRIDKYNSM